MALLAIAAGRRSAPPAAATDAPRPAPAPDAVTSAPANATAHILATEVAPLPAGEGSAPLAPSPPPAPRARRHRRAAQTAAGDTAVNEDCSPPYTVDAAGERHFKLRCLVDVRR
jgi:hypothetical protein